MKQILTLTRVICMVALLASAGCVSFAKFLFSDGESFTITPQSAAVPSVDAATITRQMLGVVDHVAIAHGLHPFQVQEAVYPRDTDTYLRRYDNETRDPHGQVVLLVLLHKGASLPTIVVQGSVGGAGEIWGIAREISKTLKREVNEVEFNRQHSYEKFCLPW